MTKSINQIKDRNDVIADSRETQGNFTYKENPNAVAVVIDTKSSTGHIQISGEERTGNTTQIETGENTKGPRYVLKNIPPRCSCMIYGKSKVWYILPKVD